MQFAASKFYFHNGNVGIGTTTPRNALHVKQPTAGNQYALFQGVGAGGTVLTGTDTIPIASSNGFIGYNGIGLIPDRWGNATTADAHNALYIGGNQRNLGATAGTIAFANWGYFTGTGTAAGGLGNATAQADAVKFGIALTDNGSAFNQKLQFSSRSATGVNTDVMTMLSNGNVGIGSSVGNPVFNLDVQSATSGADSIIRAVGNGNVSRLILQNTGTSGRQWSFSAYKNTLGPNGGLGIADETAGVVRMVIDGSGNVGIGVTNPSNQLEIGGNGTVFADGPSAIYLVGDRTTAGVSGLYRSGNYTRLWDNAFGDVMIYDTTGRVGIGASAPDYRFDVINSVAENWVARVRNTSGSTNAHGLFAQTSGPSGVAFMGQNLSTSAYSHIGYGGWGIYCGAGLCGGTSAWTPPSDIRMKQDVQSVPESAGLEAIMKLRPVTYHWKDKTQDERLGRQYGFIAQEIEKVLPETVVTVKGTSTTITLANGKQEVIKDQKAMDYGAVVVPLTKAVQQLKADNDNLRAELKAASENQAAELQMLREEFEKFKAGR